MRSLPAQGIPWLCGCARADSVLLSVINQDCTTQRLPHPVVTQPASSALTCGVTQPKGRAGKAAWSVWSCFYVLFY